MKTGLWFGLSLSLLAASALQFNATESLTIWKLTIVATEFAHWLILLPSVLLIWRYARPPQNQIVNFILFASVILFAWPSVQMATRLNGWQGQLATTFGTKVPVEAPSLSSLWWQKRELINPQTLTYWTDGSASLALDAYLPPRPLPTTQTSPWLLVIHGGGWDSGDAKQLPELNSYLARRGIAVISIDYRLAPEFKWPAQRQDAGHAVEFIKAHAVEWKLDPTRWAVLGRSAGGQIAEALAFQSPDPTLKGVIALYAPSDMNFAYTWGREDDILASRQLVRDFLGGDPAQVPLIFNDASPLDFVTAQSPPVLMLHGPRDRLVWYRHSERLDQRLKEKGVPSVFIELPWATHGFDYNLSGPGGLVSTYAITFFLRQAFFKGDAP